MKYIAFVLALSATAAGFASLGNLEILLHDADGNLINGVNAYACYYDADRPPVNAINGSGLTPDGSGGYTCSTDKTTMWMGSGNDKEFSNWFLVDLGREEYLDRIDLWNFNMRLGNSAYEDRGVKVLAVFTATDATATNSLPFAPNGSLDNCEHPLSTDTSNYFAWGEDNANVDADVWTLKAGGYEIGELTKASGGTSYSMPNKIYLDPGKARWVLIKIGGVFKGGYGGVSELQFFYDDYCSVESSTPDVINIDSAVLSADLLLKDNVESGEVVLVYGKTAGGETVESWEHSITNSDAAAGKVSFTVDGLDVETAYHYAFFGIDRAQVETVDVTRMFAAVA